MTPEAEERQRGAGRDRAGLYQIREEWGEAGGSSLKAFCTVQLEIFRTYDSLKLNLAVASKNTYIYHIF